MGGRIRPSVALKNISEPFLSRVFCFRRGLVPLVAYFPEVACLRSKRDTKSRFVHKKTKPLLRTPSNRSFKDHFIKVCLEAFFKRQLTYIRMRPIRRKRSPKQGILRQQKAQGTFWVRHFGRDLPSHSRHGTVMHLRQTSPGSHFG